MEKTNLFSKCGFLWIDLEMTGLDSSVDQILEIAVIATDVALERVFEGPSLVIHHNESAFLHMDEWCKEHHKKSGLLERVVASTMTCAQAEREVLAFVQEHCSSHRLLFAGNTIYQDRAFLVRFMPQLNARGHYRLIDVSTIKELVKAWYPHDPLNDFKKEKKHRALDDIRESIEELRYYRKCFFKS